MSKWQVSPRGLHDVSPTWPWPWSAPCAVPLWHTNARCPSPVSHTRPSLRSCDTHWPKHIKRCSETNSHVLQRGNGGGPGGGLACPGVVVRAPFPEPPPHPVFRAHVTGTSDGLMGEGGSQGTLTFLAQNDPPQCADHFEVCIMGEFSSGPLRDAGGESSLVFSPDCLDWPVKRGSFCRPPPPVPSASQFSTCPRNVQARPTWFLPPASQTVCP